MKTVQEAVAEPGVSVVIFESPCIAIVKPQRMIHVDAQKCKACGRCVREIGCPALFVGADKKVFVEPSLCTGCGLCTDVCPFDAIGGEPL